MSNSKKFRNKKKGFTLIELIVVISIIGILAVILLPKFGGFTDKARKKSVMSEAKTVYTAMETYYAENGRYPTNVNSLENIDKLKTTKVCDKNKTDVQTIKIIDSENTLFTYAKDGFMATCTKDGEIKVEGVGDK
ncbi:type II secretion system protein [Hathewaya massiliensis]|uniref:type II secretion system protein n=1 Tax=Hathewaya massiliensis TaxID=1964382 RepID=UPI0011585CF5|nr:prepilin-type N-terminal cleavage/methylation domain-containing protein [Hathewaya massiliensis]